MAEDLSETINDAAQEPRTVEVDGQRVTQHPIKDLIAAENYRLSKVAATKPALGIRLGRMIPPGSV